MGIGLDRHATFPTAGDRWSLDRSRAKENPGLSGGVNDHWRKPLGQLLREWEDPVRRGG